MSISKPAFGAPCNGCGACCMAETCALGEGLLPLASPCPALEQDEGRYWCGLARNPSKYFAPHFSEQDQRKADEWLGAMIRGALGIGRGCDADD